MMLVTRSLFYSSLGHNFAIRLNAYYFYAVPISEEGIITAIPVN